MTDDEKPASPPEGPAGNEPPAPSADAPPPEKQTLTIGQTYSAVKKRLSQDEDWKRLGWLERTQLSTAYTVGVLASSVMRDMGDHVVLAAAAAVPGPSGPVIGAGLLLSYAFRWDARGKEVRHKLAGLWRNGVPLEDYEDVISQSDKNPDKLDVNTGGLLVKKGTLLKDEYIDSNKRILIKIGNTYISVRDFTGTHTGNATQAVLSPVVGKDNAENFVKNAGDGFETGERAVGSTFKWAAGHAMTAASGALSGLKWSWNKAAEGVGAVSRRFSPGKDAEKDQKDDPPPPSPG